MKHRVSMIFFALLVGIFIFSCMVQFCNAATDAQIKDAIERGLTWLATQQNPADGSWGWSVAHTALAVLKFEDYAFEIGMTPFDPNYAYSQNVINGLNYIFSNTSIVNISVQPAGNPDTNGNGTGVYFNWGTYYQGTAMMAIAGSKDPNRVVSGGACNGLTYKQVLQDALDYLAFGQTDPNCGEWPCADRGGWSYDAIDHCCGSDNSNGGYAVLGLGYAQVEPFNCTVPQWVLTELSLYCDYIQNDVNGDADDGGSGYSGPDDGWVNVLKTGNLIYEMALVGDTDQTQRVKDAVAYLIRHWGDNADPGWRPNHYQAMYTNMKQV